MAGVLGQVPGEVIAESLYGIQTANDAREFSLRNCWIIIANLFTNTRLKSSSIVRSGVVPRIAADNSFHSKGLSLNNRLETLWKEQGVEFFVM